MNDENQRPKLLIDQMLDGAKEVIALAKRPFERKRIKRAFESAIDSADEKISDSEVKILKLREKLVKDTSKAGEVLNEIVAEKVIIKRAMQTKEVVKTEQMAWFGEKE